jgi:uncharacterized membrane protein YuzA (DUF378 family)
MCIKNFNAAKIILDRKYKFSKYDLIYKEVKNMLDRIALLLVIIGAFNWGSIGLFGFDIVGWIFGGTGALASRIFFTLVALAGVWCISLLFRSREEITAGDKE